jgi:CRP/FNR family cyclic AMP-dependent transcriptional regulator
MTNIFSLFEKSKTFQPGEIIIREGEENRDLYVLYEGVLEASIKTDRGDLVVSEMTPPEIMGEISFLDGSPRTATVTAKTEALVYYLSYDDVSSEMAEIPAWFKLVLQTLTKRMKSCGVKIKEMEKELLWLRSNHEV